jgi:hypothetical protein
LKRPTGRRAALPSAQPSPDCRASCEALSAGAGADINLSRHVFVRAEYRGLIYNSPTYGMAALAGTDRVTHRAEPTVGFGWHF